MNDNEKNTPNDQITIPWFTHEAEVSRLERTIKRLWISGLVIFAAFVISNLVWIGYEMQFENVSTTITQDLDSGEGGTATINGDINFNGESEKDNNSNDTEKENGR